MQEYMTSDSESDRSSISSINFTGLDKLIGISDGSNASRPRFKNQERLAMMQRKALDNSETDSATTGSESKGGSKGRRRGSNQAPRSRKGGRKRKHGQLKQKKRNSGPNPQAHLPNAQSNAAMTDPSEDHEDTESENDGMNDRTTRTKNQERFATMQGDRTRPQKPRPQMTARRDGNAYGRTESESESESESDMSGGEMMRRMEANSKRIIVDESSNSEAESEVESETESETTKSEWEETVNMARQRRVGTNRRADDPDTWESQEETESDDDTDQDKKPRAKRKR
jgi:hypothetical protein